jgi:hypothetical protein
MLICMMSLVGCIHHLNLPVVEMHSHTFFWGCANQNGRLHAPCVALPWDTLGNAVLCANGDAAAAAACFNFFFFVLRFAVRTLPTIFSNVYFW